MNVLSLPDEMIASFTKYMEFEECRNVRKMNQRMDSVAKKFTLDKRNFYSIGVYNFMLPAGMGFRWETKQNTVRHKRITRTGQLELDQQIRSEMIQKFLNMARRVENLSLEIDINEEMLTHLYRFAKVIRNTALEIRTRKISISAEQLMNFANTVKLSQLGLQYVNFDEEKSLSDKVLANFNPSINLEFENIQVPKITVLGLQSRVFSNKLMLSLRHCRSGITAKDMIQFLKINRTICNNIDFGVLSKMKASHHAIQEVLEECNLEFFKEYSNWPQSTKTYICINKQNGARITFELA